MFKRKQYSDNGADDNLTLKNSLISVLLEQEFWSTIIDLMGLQRQEAQLTMLSRGSTELLSTIETLGLRHKDIKVHDKCAKEISMYLEHSLLGTVE